jgi:hypothetical protein
MKECVISRISRLLAYCRNAGEVPVFPLKAGKDKVFGMIFRFYNYRRLFQNFSFGTATLKFVVLQG